MATPGQNINIFSLMFYRFGERRVGEKEGGGGASNEPPDEAAGLKAHSQNNAD